MTKVPTQENLEGQHEPSRAYRWLVLIVISMAMFGNYYIYDCISPLADVLKQQLGFSDANIGLLQAIYSIPNVFMVLIGGFIVDRIGTRKSTLLFASVCLMGALVTAWRGNLQIMATGRLLFGLGAESLGRVVLQKVAMAVVHKHRFRFGLFRRSHRVLVSRIAC